MTSPKETPRHLIVVATRWYSEQGSSDDEFCRQWGLDVSKDHMWFDNLHPEVLLLVLHGYKEDGKPRSISEAIEIAAKDEKCPKDMSLVKRAWFCHHSLAGSARDDADKLKAEVDSATKAIESFGKSFGVSDVTPVLYRSEGGLAVTQLVLALRACGARTPKLLADAVEKAAGGRTLFVERLRGVQSGLIRMRLLLEVEWRKGLSKKDVPLLQLAMGACRIADGGRFGDWIGVLKDRPPHDPDIAGALSVLRVLGGQPSAGDVAKQEPPVPRPTAKVWGSLNSAARIFLAASRNASEAVRQDIALFARSLDILLEAAESLPPAIAMPPSESASEGPET